MIYVFLIILGLGLGSFVNALIWRIRQQTNDDGDPKKLTKKQKKELSILTGRSMCPHCEYTLAAKDLVPVFSWLWLRGKCRYCKKPISWQYPAVEAFTALLFVVSYIFWPQNLDVLWQWLVFVNWLLALVGLVALAIYDIRWMLLPDRILYVFAGIGLVITSLTFIFGRPLQDVWHISLAMLVGGGLFWLVFQLSKGRLIGGGDVKLGFYLGFLLANPGLALAMLLVASVLGTIFVLPLLATKRVSRNSHIPFGPFLIIATILVMFWGQIVIDWYMNSLVQATM